MTNATLLFATGSSAVRAGATERAALMTLAKAAKAGSALTVEGHADTTGTDAQNQALSLARANAVKAMLVSMGAPADKVQTSGAGASKPVAGNDDASGRAKNRRVEVRL